VTHGSHSFLVVFELTVVLVGPLKATLYLEPEPPDDVKRRLVGVARHATLVNALAHPPEVDIRFAGEGSGGE
jgi:hypothetical protein